MKTKAKAARPTLKDFRQQVQNANAHTERGMALLQTSMEEVGYTAPMIAAADGEIISGSARHEQACDVFGPDIEPIIVESDGKRPVVVVRSDVPNAQDRRAKRISILENRVAELDLDWKPEVLASLQQADASLLAGAFGDRELIAFLAKQEAPTEFKELGEGLKVDHICPKCGYKWSGGTSVE